MRWANRTLSAAFSVWISRARREQVCASMLQMQVLDKGKNAPLDSAFDTWVLHTCREQRLREIEANNLVSSYMSEKEAEAQILNSTLPTAFKANVLGHLLFGH
jgi:hypothetical protein